MNVRSLFEEAAKGPLAWREVDGVECEAARFYEVDAGAARVLHALANIQKLPAVHVYKSGELVDTRSVHTPALWQECAESIALHAADFGP